MASEMSPDSPGQHREDGTHLRDTASPEAGTPPEPNTDPDTQRAPAESAEQVQEKVNVCPFFLRQKCRFGDRCRLLHSGPTPDDSGAMLSDQDDTSAEEKIVHHKKKKGKMEKAKKPDHNKGDGHKLNKKPPMRTAADVISRILWDPLVDSSQFVVGYVDRFLGVLERPFCDFNWKISPYDCDYTSELALPRHRIQYFTYRGLRVWDRQARKDRVFGSTGQSLAPPFGKEEEVKEVNTDVQEQQDGPAVSGKEERDTGDCADTQDTHLEEGKQNEMNIHVPDSTQAAPTCGGNASQAQQESQGPCVVEEVAERLEDSTGKMSKKECETVKEEAEEVAEWHEDWDDKEDALGCLAALKINKAPLEQRTEAGGGRPAKKRPTHFITFRANTPAILSGFQQLQAEITSLLPGSTPHWMAATSLHVTLCLLVLHGPAEVAAAGEILQRFASFDRNPLVTLNFPVKLKHFYGRVLYLSPQPQLPLQQLNSGLQEAYRTKGWLHRDSYNPRYHLTLAKVGDIGGGRVFEGVGDLKVEKSLNFGRLPINTLHLCVVSGAKVDGFYEIVSTVNLR